MHLKMDIKDIIIILKWLPILSTSSIVQSDKYSQLTLTSPSAEDTGQYSCWVVVCDGRDCEKDHDHVYSSNIYFAGE